MAADFFEQPSFYEPKELCPAPEAVESLTVRVGQTRHQVNHHFCPAAPQAVLDLFDAVEAAGQVATTCPEPTCVVGGCHDEVCASSL